MIERACITSFRGEYWFLSNFHPAQVSFEGTIYPTVEHAYAAAKTTSPALRRQILQTSKPGDAKRLAKSAKLHPEWHQHKHHVMADLVLQKFYNIQPLRARLVYTGNAQLIEGNTWGDQCWGAVLVDGQWIGQNHLGKLLMHIRSSLLATGQTYERLHADLQHRAGTIA